MKTTATPTKPVAEFNVLKEGARRLLHRGILCDAGDIPALDAMLDACTGAGDLNRWYAICRRWLYATEPIPSWVAWQDELIITAN